MNKKVNIILILIISCLNTVLAQSSIGINDVQAYQIQIQSKDGSPIKRLTADAKCKMKLFFGNICYT